MPGFRDLLTRRVVLTFLSKQQLLCLDLRWIKITLKKFYFILKVSLVMQAVCILDQVLKVIGASLYLPELVLTVLSITLNFFLFAVKKEHHLINGWKL
jgi:hypothetical protein